MTSTVEKDPWLLTFRIGAVKIAEVSFLSNKVVQLRMWGASPVFAEPQAVKKAMTHMHELLRSPPNVEV